MKNSLAAAETTNPASRYDWRKPVAPFQKPDARRSWFQVANTLIPYFACWFFIYLSLSHSYWLTVPLILLAGGLLVRAFVLFHDCGHGSLFKSRKVNDWLGMFIGVLVFTPYYNWRRDHALHHATSGNLDRRGAGDIWTMTVQEYLACSWRWRLTYRLARNPFILFGPVPVLLFIFGQRYPTANAPARERHSVYWTNAAILVTGAAMSWIFGFKTYLIVQLSMMVVAGSVGVWLFYVQHQFDGVYWERQENWNYIKGALEGSSFYKLPKIFQWFSGNMGFHHVHHLIPMVPNYYLEKCHKSVPLFQTVKPLSLFASFKSATFRLYDEQSQRLVGFGILKQIKQRNRLSASGTEFSTHF